MRPQRRVVMDVSHLPTHAFGIRDLMAWGTFAFILIEGFTLFLAAVTYLYLTKNFGAWPPEGTPRPSVVVPTVQLALMVASLPFMQWVSRRAHEYDLERVRFGLTVAAGISVVINGLRAWELLRSLEVRWDANAYGSAQWLVVGAHATLLAIQLYELAGMALIFWRGPVEKKHFSDAADVSVYWIFIVVSWIPLYVLCFLLPHWI